MSTNTTLQIKRSANTAVPSSLANGELAFSSNGGVLFIGDPATGAVQAIGGDRAPGTLTANQAIVVDGNSHIDVVKATGLQLTGSGVANVSMKGVIQANTLLGSNSTTLATSEAIKAYVDTQGSPANTSTSNATYTSGNNTLTFTRENSSTFDVQLTGLSGASNVSTLGDTTITGLAAADIVAASNTTHYRNLGLSGDITATANNTDLITTVGSLKVTPDKIQGANVIITVSGGKYYIDGTQQEPLRMVPGVEYYFDQSDNTNSSHPLRLSTTPDGTHGGGSEYTTNRTTSGSPGNAGAYVRFVLPMDAPDTLYYYCTAHSGMGGRVEVKDSNKYTNSSGSVFSGNVYGNNVIVSNDLTAGDVVISGNLTVSGTRTLVNSTDLNVNDAIITLASGQTGTPSQDSGIEVERGSSANVAIKWNETTDKWTFTNDGSTYSNIAAEVANTSVSSASFADANDTITFTRADSSSFDVALTGFQTTINAISIGADKIKGANVVVTVSGGKFLIDGTSQENIKMVPGVEYYFDQSDNTNSSHPLRLSVTNDGTHGGGSEYTEGRSNSSASAGSAGAYVRYVLPMDAPDTLYYYCTNHSGMGARVQVKDSNKYTNSSGSVVSGNSYATNMIATDTVTATTNLKDGSNRTLKVYYANGDVAWG